jgi:hypothetical protein
VFGAHVSKPMRCCVLVLQLLLVPSLTAPPPLVPTLSVCSTAWVSVTRTLWLCQGLTHWGGQDPRGQGLVSHLGGAGGHCY